ncbi:MAG: hypothetical protein II961_00450 [Candidatus Riflebacteria bacterium]|nr:hypothetical protein [Candidatus Riflebacteria bacterium]
MSQITVSVKIIANFFGVNERTIRQWVQKGMPRVADGVYSPRDCFNWWDEYINESAVGDDDKNKDAKERYWAAKAGNEELKFEKTKGELVSKDKVENSFAARAYELSLSFRALKYRLPPMLEGKNREDIQNELGKELNRILDTYKRAGSFVPEGLEDILKYLQKQEKFYLTEARKTSRTTKTKKAASKRGKK